MNAIVKNHAADPVNDQVPDGLAQTWQLAANGDAARRARQFVRQFCIDVGCDDVVGDASVVVTELVTNAVVHAMTPSEVRLRYTDSVLRIEVADGDRTSPQVRNAFAFDESGRGLVLVEALSRAWGSELDDAGKVVWAELTQEMARMPQPISIK